MFAQPSAVQRVTKAEFGKFANRWTPSAYKLQFCKLLAWPLRPPRHRRYTLLDLESEYNMPASFTTITLLLASNVFMTFAWYGHLKFKAAPLLLVILVSWGIAFFEYMLQVPANRIGHAVFTAAQLKTIQEVITLLVFSVFSVTYLKEPLSWNHALGFGCIAVGAFFIFHKW